MHNLTSYKAPHDLIEYAGVPEHTHIVIAAQSDRDGLVQRDRGVFTECPEFDTPMISKMVRYREAECRLMRL